MRRRLAAIMFLATASVLGGSDGVVAATPPPPPPIPTPSGPNAVAQIYPYEGHQGDPIFVSGVGFRPNTRLIFFLFCPSAYDAQAIIAHNYIHEVGPATGNRGNFTAYRFKTKLELHGVESSPCLLYVDDANGPVSDFPVPYYVQANDVPLPKCVRQICATVKVRHIMLRGKQYERVAIQTVGPMINHKRVFQSWMGARASISVSYPSLRPNVAIKTSAMVNWQGQATVNIPLQTNIPQNARGVVHVSLHLGPNKGDGIQRFTVPAHH